MFERYTAQARRVIFFARYEASNFGSPHIDTEHLVLGLMREGGWLLGALPGGNAAAEAIRKRVEAYADPDRRQKIPPADLLISHSSMQALAHAAGEADRLKSSRSTACIWRSVFYAIRSALAHSCCANMALTRRRSR